jgi:hypothetical protein
MCIFFPVTFLLLSDIERFLDVGSGLGKPNMHILQRLGVRLSMGVEVCKIRYNVSNINENIIDQHLRSSYDYSHLNTFIPSQLSIINLDALLKDEDLRSRNLNFLLGDICKFDSFDPFTVVHMYDLAFTPEDQKALAEIWNNRYFMIF